MDQMHDDSISVSPSTGQSVSHLTTMPRTITCIRLHAYSDRARFSERVVYEYNRRIDRLTAWPW